MSQVLKIKHEATPGGCVIFITVDTDEIIGVRLTDGHVIDLRERPPYWCTSPCMYCNGTKGSDCFKHPNVLKHIDTRFGTPWNSEPAPGYKGCREELAKENGLFAFPASRVHIGELK